MTIHCGVNVQVCAIGFAIVKASTETRLHEATRDRFMFLKYLQLRPVKPENGTHAAQHAHMIA